MRVTIRNVFQSWLLASVLVVGTCGARSEDRPNPERPIDFAENSRKALKAVLANARERDRGIVVRELFLASAALVGEEARTDGAQGELTQIDSDGNGLLRSTQMSPAASSGSGEFSLNAGIAKRRIAAVTAHVKLPNLDSPIADVKAGKFNSITLLLRLAASSSDFDEEARGYTHVGEWELEYRRLATTSSVIEGFGFLVECKLRGGNRNEKRIVLGAYEQMGPRYQPEKEKPKIVLLPVPHGNRGEKEVFFLVAAFGG